MEQMKMIKTLQQSQQEYKSPFCWYNIVADMLMKVIADEERVQQREIIKSLSSDNIKRMNEKICDQRNKSVEKPSHLTRKNNLNTIIKEKKIRCVPYSQFRPKENYLTDRKEDHPSLLRPTRDTEFETIECPELVSKTSMDSKLNDISSLTKNYETYESPFLKCPLCGWEDIKNKEIENSKKNYIPCSAYNKDIFGIYTNCAGCDKVTRDNLPYQSLGNHDLSIYCSKKDVNFCGDSEILRELPKYTSNENLITKSKSTSVEYVKEKQKTYTNAEVQYDTDSKKSSKHDIETPMQINIPVMTNKLQFDTIKASTHLKIILSDPNKSKPLAIENACQDMKFIQNYPKLETSSKETQVFPEKIHQSKKIDIDTNTINYIDKEVQNTVSTSRIKKCVSLQTLNQIDQKQNQTDKYKKSSTESKEVLVNIIDQISKGIQTTIFVSRGNLTCHISLQNMKETGTTMSIHQIRNIGCVTKESKQFKSNFVQCVSKEKFPSLIQSKSCNSVTYIQKDWNTDLKHCIKKKKSEDSCLINTCPKNILHLCKEDPSVMSLLQQLLQNILFIHEEKTQCGKLKKQIDFPDDYKYYPKENCLINPTKMVSAIKSHIMMLELKDIKELKESYQKLGTKSFSQGVQKKPSLKKIDTSICNNKLIMTEEIFVPIFRSTITKQDEKQKIMDKKKKFLMTDKNVCTYLNCKDIGINGSFHRDIQIQSDSQLFKDSACLARDIRQRVNVGVQKRDPILVRVIKCNENQAIVRSDKETMMTDMNYEKKYISKRIETCGRSTCIPSTICKKLSETNLNCALYKERANQIIDNYYKQSFKNNICDINCKNNMLYDWTNVTNNVVNSKIPMCIRSQKYMYARNK